MEYIKKGISFFDREISWLGFNDRVLQEAEDPTVPVINRLQFLAIFSSNLDEFYKVRVASIRHMIRVTKKKSRKEKLKETLRTINTKTEKLQDRFGKIYRDQILPELEAKNVFLKKPEDLSDAEREFVLSYFQEHIREKLLLIPISEKMFLKNERLYHVIAYRKNERQELAVIPFPDLPRFFEIPNPENATIVLMLDDVLRLGLKEKYGPQTQCWSVKMNRDAELYLNDELAESVKEKIKKSLKKRQTGIPSRFLFDESLPKEILDRAIESYDLDADDLVRGGRYHNYFDFWKMPYPDHAALTYPKMEALKYASFEEVEQLKSAVAQQDHLLHFPYQDYGYVIKMLHQAAHDPEVQSIKMTLYRAASDSAIFKALKDAALNGKEVLLFNEVQARFDEENNMRIGEELERVGAKVLYSYEGLKVHSKIVLITRKVDGQEVYQSVLATGNFNEKTAKIYSDMALFTANQAIGQELKSVFDFLENPAGKIHFDHLLVAQHNMRKQFEELIDREMANVEAGKHGEIFCKMNSLQDRKMIGKLYEASQKGVKVKLLVRGICCLIPGREGLSENIVVRSIVGRFLEHARVFVFHNDGQEVMYAGSADWMTRNLKRRIEVIFPIANGSLSDQVKTMMELQWNDTQKARQINQIQDNMYCFDRKAEQIDSQHAFYEYLKGE